MANKKDFATSTVLTAPSPADSGTSLVVASGHGARFPAAPFYIVAHPPSEMPTIDNAEKILVTAKSTDTFTLDRAEGDPAAKSIEAGWRVSNVLFLDDIPDTFDDLTDGTTNKAFTSTLKTKLDGIETAADVTDAGNVGSSIFGASAKTTPVDADTVGITDSAASNALKKVTWANIKATLKTYFDTLYQPIDATLTALAGLVTGANKIPYSTGTDTFGQLDLSTSTSLGASDTTLSTQNAIKTYVDAAITAAKSALMPVGTIVTLGVSTNPGTLYGFGTWTAITDRVIVGKGSSGTFATLDATGGAETHTLTAAQQANATGSLAMHGGENSTFFAGWGGIVSAPEVYGGGYKAPPSTTGGANSARYGLNFDLGFGGQPHNNLQPYIVKYIWQRTA